MRHLHFSNKKNVPPYAMETAMANAIAAAIAVLSSVLISSALTGCGSTSVSQTPAEASAAEDSSESSVQETVTEASEVPAAKTPADVTAPEADPAPSSSDVSEASDKSGSTSEATYEGPLPDCFMTNESLEKLREGDTYALYDVDCDGRDELVICAENDMGESVQSVYDVEEDNVLFQEISIPYSLLFYSNGNMMALWPNNKGLNPDMMPYNMYSYDPDKDVYEYAGYVDSWNIEYNATDYEGNDFPAEYDKDEDGILYSIYYGEDFGYGYTHDGDDLDEVLSDLFGDADVIDLTFKKTSSLF